jgi:ABC-type transport system involved in cytochrome bd biosynthesis fused ATPase/permease subunit
MISEKLRKAWEDNVWSKVIAGLILTAILGFFTHLFGFLPHLFTFLKFIFSSILSTISVPIWVIVFACLPIIILGYIAFQAISVNMSRPKYFNYTEDIFYDLIWHWEWQPKNESRSKPQLTNLHARRLSDLTRM